MELNADGGLLDAFHNDKDCDCVFDNVNETLIVWKQVDKQIFSF